MALARGASAADNSLASHFAVPLEEHVMRWSHLLSSFGHARRRLRVCHPATRSAVSFRPQLEVLEDRHLLSTFTVVLATDNGGPSGQKVSATTGDLRYCVEQADAAHTATTDSIGFSSKLTTTPHTITLNSANGPLVLSDSHPLTINGPTGLTINVSGGNQVEVFDVASGMVTIKNLPIIYGKAANGGGIYNQGTLTLSNCILDHDSANAGDGGGIFNVGTLTLTKTTLYLDSALRGGGIFNNGAAATATLTSSNLSNDTATSGGGFFNNSGTATLTKCALTNNSAFDGGGIFTNGTATLTNVTLSGNSATHEAGGVRNDTSGTATLSGCTLANDSAMFGGGIVNFGTLTVTNSTFSNDSASSDGGGIAMALSATATLTNCTLANNSTTGGNGSNSGGGGIWLTDSPTLTLINCTLSNDSAFANGGGIWNAFNGGTITLNLINTIVAGNSAPTNGPDIYGAVTTADHNLVGDATGSTGITNGMGGNIVGGNGNPVIDARLGPLQNNGGPTETMALLADSPAIGHADNTMAPATDQRGHTRIDEAGETTDIGVFEL